MPDPTSPLYRSFIAVAGSRLQVEKDCRLAGNVHGNANVDLDTGDLVTGNVSAVGRVDDRGTVTGTVTSGAPARTLPQLPTEAQARALANRVFEKDTAFKNAEIDDVVFVAGDAHIEGSLNGTGTIIARGDVLLDDVDPNQPITLAPTSRLSLLAFHDLHVGKARPFRGLLLAGHNARLAAKASLAGVLVTLHQLYLEHDSHLAFLELDATPPSISNLAPAGGSLLASATPTIAAAFADGLSGVDPASVHFLLDGADRTSAAQVTAAGLTFTPSAPLPDGSHAAAVSVRDLAGNLAQAQWSFTTDTTAPILVFTSPSGQVAPGTSPPIVVAYTDATSGVNLGSLRVSLDAVDITAGCAAGPASAACASPALAAGSHSLAASIRDQAGNAATASLTFQVSAPLPVIAITSPAGGSYSKVASIQVVGTVNSVVTAVTVGGQPAALAQGGFTATVTLAQGANGLVAVATDAAGNQASAAALVTLDTTPPAVTLTTPAPGAITNRPQVQVAGSATDDSGIALLTVAGQPVAVDNGQFATSVAVAEGANQIEVDAFDLAGNKQTATVAVTRFTVPTVTITSPGDLSYVNATTVTVSGTVNTAATVSVNGVAATTAGASFTVTGVPLIEGGNTLTATATDAAGHVGLASINVVRDLTPPHVAIYTPAAGATLADATVTVSGLVNDIVAGTVNAGNVTVSVNGLPATVANRSFLVAGVPLQPGDNVLTAVAVDASGNQAQASITVHQAAPMSARVAEVSGSGQSAVIRTLLSQPLVAVLLDAAGHPVPGKAVLFSVRGGDGTLDGGRRHLAVTSDANGQAQAHFTLGSRAGAGNQVVEAQAVGFGPPAVFLASALPGAPALIVVDSGDQQLGVAGQALPRPLVAVVVDAGSNRLPGIAASFRVVKGAGQFSNGQSTLSLATDSDGRLIATLTTDPNEGVAANVVEATIAALPASPVASFGASTWAAGDPSKTAVSGVVLDNSNLPVAGVTVRLRDTALTALTDVQGQFQISPAPVGTLKLIVDGSTAQRPGAWPDLEFDLTTVPGRNNTLRMPIYLLPLDLVNGIQVDETHGGTLTLPQLPGFALQIQPGSVTFPGGGRSGVVSVTVVHSDKVPMVPNFGQQPRLIVTIQPAGARFDPPARLSMPNVEGLAPGQVTDFYSFDHDLGHFVSIGPGTVSDDGLVVTSNVGVGIVKAGWHCCGFPQGTGTPNSCPLCTECFLDLCIPKLCQKCGDLPGTVCDGSAHCVYPRQIIPEICSLISIKYDEVSRNQCQGDPVHGGPGLCGEVLLVKYTKVVIDGCPDVDLAGAISTEDIVSDHGCGSPERFRPDQGGLLNVTTGNNLVGYDDYSYCAPIAFMPRNDCTETYTQTQHIDGTICNKTVTIAFTLHRTTTGCSGTATREP
jgi:glucodextranase-like protein/Big-like domain-containing protein